MSRASPQVFIRHGRRLIPMQQWSAERLKQKQTWRRDQAGLPFEEKLRLLVRLQRRAYDIGKASGHHAPAPWTLR